MFHFVANLKPYTLPEVVSDDRFDAYLLSADYTSGLAELASVVRAEQRVLVADNGNMDALRSLAREFVSEAAELDAERKAWERTRGAYARPRQLPAALRRRFEALAGRIAERSQAITTDEFAHAAVRRQSSIDPTMLVGMEDFTLATMGSLNLEPEYMELPSSFFEARVERAVDFAQRTKRGDLGEVRGQVLAGLHALDFDSGVLAGRRAGEAGLEGVTVGMFGALTDRNYVDFRVEDGEIMDLGTVVPRPYLRVIELAAGVLEGFRRAGRRRPAFHALGVGTPILLPLLSLLGAGEDYFATDSTAPIVDGWSSPTISLYVSEPAPIKYKAHRIAEVWLNGGRGWDCECPHCARFHDAHPPDLGRAQRWWREQGKPKIVKEMLERRGSLSPYLPFLGYSADDELRTEAALARVGHNHWALRQLELEIRKRSERWPELLAWVEGIVGAYQQASGSDAWSAAVNEAFALARSIGERLWQAALQHPVEPVAARLLPEDVDDVGVEEDEGQRCHPGDECDRDPAPHQPPVGVPMPRPSLGRAPHPTPVGVPVPTPSLVLVHGRTVADPEQLDNGCDRSANRAPRTSPAGGEVQEASPMEHVQPLTQPSSRVLLQQTVLELGKIESISLTWDELQPLAMNLAGRAAAMLDALQADTMMGAAELEHLGEQMQPWRQILEEAASAESEQAQTWKEGFLTAMSETVGAAEAQARLDALLKGDAPLLRIVELKQRAIQLTQSPFVAAHVAATAASHRLGGLAAYLASRAQAEGKQDSSPL
ncbi:MAG TPA: hypothetical protein VK034_07115, partial [Enhygromyxa sp.]|nr:hypothetical protein [Enhygromyxa sp.]